VLAGAVLSGGAQFAIAAANHRRDKAWALLEERRRRLEDVYSALEDLSAAAGEAYMRAWREVVIGPSPPGGESPTTSLPSGRLRMLVGLYHPHLADHLVALEEARRALILRFVLVRSPDPPAEAGSKLTWTPSGPPRRRCTRRSCTRQRRTGRNGRAHEYARRGVPARAAPFAWSYPGTN
jgi:hypothetical protein